MRIDRIEPPHIRALTKKVQPTSWNFAEEPHAIRHNYMNKEVSVGGGIAGMRRFVREELEALPENGTLLTIDRCCDSGQALAEFLIRDGCKLQVTNLNHKEIFALQPQSVMLFATTIVKRRSTWTNPISAKALGDFTRKVFPHCGVGDLHYELPDKFVVGLLDIAITWKHDGS